MLRSAVARGVFGHQPPAPGLPRPAPQGWTALLVAAQDGDTETVKALLSAGANKEATIQVFSCCAAQHYRDIHYACM
jgi:hypothetical protein